MRPDNSDSGGRGFESRQPYQTHKIRTGSSLWETGSDFVFSLGMITSETA